MKNLALWASIPLIFGFAAALTLGLIYLPFRFADTDHAAQFYGAFLAAFVAAFAVVGNSRYNDYLARRRDAEARERNEIKNALSVWSFITRAKLHLGGVVNVMGTCTYKPMQTRAGAMEVTDSPTSKFRTAARSDYKFDQVMAEASALPPEIAMSVVRAISSFDSTFNAVLRFPWMDDDHPISRANITGAVQWCNGCLTYAREAEVALATHLTKHGYIGNQKN